MTNMEENCQKVSMLWFKEFEDDSISENLQENHFEKI